MTKITFTKENISRKTMTTRVKLEGHAGYSIFGSDIVCAAISMASQMTLIALSEVEKLKIWVESDERLGLMSIRVSYSNAEEAQPYFETLELVLKQLSIQYPENVYVCEHLI